MVAWFAGLFYIFRLFVYHRIRHTSTEVCELLSLMEKRLLSFIVLPASLATLFFGLSLLALNPSLLERPWLWIKLCLVISLFGYQWLATYTRRKFSHGDFFLTEKNCRLINEFPTLVLIVVVLLAVLKPWS